MSAPQIIEPDVDELRQEVGLQARSALSLVVISDAQRTCALLLAKEIKARERQIVDAFEPSRKAYDHAKKELLALRDGLLEPLREALRLIDKKCGAFEKVQKEAAAIERKRLEEIAAAQQEEQRLMDAAMAETPEAAEEALTEALPPPVVVAPDAVEKVSGVYTREQWKSTVEDKRLFIQHCVDNPHLRYLLDVNEPGVNSLVRQHEGKIELPGIKIEQMSVRSFRR